MIAITGARGVGKTTMLLQYIHLQLNHHPDEVIYVSMDDLYFSRTTLVDFADAFVKRGGKYIFLDEVHKYRNWSTEIKNIYDYFTDLRIVITGSSALDIYRGTADLSRRVVLYRMQGLSFREFIEMKYQYVFPVLSLDDILYHASDHIPGILTRIKPIKLFEEYIQTGYYPFFTEETSTYYYRLQQIVNHVLEVDLPSIENIDFYAVHHLRKLLSLLSSMVPFKPNIQKLSQQVGLSRETLTKYLLLLEKADLLMLLQSGKKGISRMNKPDKIYLNNPNLMVSLAETSVNKGTLRETFLLNQLRERYLAGLSEKGDFLVEDKFILEAGGKSKDRKQIAGMENAFVVADDIEYAYRNTIPLWMFGFLY